MDKIIIEQKKNKLLLMGIAIGCLILSLGFAGSAYTEIGDFSHFPSFIFIGAITPIFVIYASIKNPRLKALFNFKKIVITSASIIAPVIIASHFGKSATMYVLAAYVFSYTILIMRVYFTKASIRSIEISEEGIVQRDSFSCVKLEWSNVDELIYDKDIIALIPKDSTKLDEQLNIFTRFFWCSYKKSILVIPCLYLPMDNDKLHILIRSAYERNKEVFSNG